MHSTLLLAVFSCILHVRAQNPYEGYGVLQPVASSGNIVHPTLAPEDSVDMYESEEEEATFKVVQPPFPEVVVPDTLPPPVYPPAPPPIDVPDNSFAINYCDKKEFPNDVLASYQLERVDYFIYNTSCSDVFFQCSIGQTFVLRCSSPEQAFDRSVVNCNFRNAVKICPEYDHVMHCTIKDQCTSNEYACCALPQACVHMSKRCDGHPDCADGEDETNCPSCARNQFACMKSGDCIDAAKRCDGVADDCGDGSNLDEIGCSRNTTCVGKFMCDQSKGGVSCIEWDHHCDGKPDCLNGEDEYNCRQAERVKYILCENQKQSVTKLQWCNSEPDCEDGSDEKYC